jgi:hypothetical protein
MYVRMNMYESMYTYTNAWDVHIYMYTYDRYAEW